MEGSARSRDGRQTAHDRETSNRHMYSAGTRTANTSRIVGVERVFDNFIGGCDLNTTEKNILSHCASNDDAPKHCESLGTRSYWCKQLKLLVNANKL